MHITQTFFVDTVQCSRVACTNIIETTDGFQWSRPVHRRFTAWLASGSFFCVVHSGRDGLQQSASRRVLLLSVGVGSQQSASLRWMVVAPKGLLSFFMVDLSHAYLRWTRLGECDVKTPIIHGWYMEIRLLYIPKPQAAMWASPQVSGGRARNRLS